MKSPAPLSRLTHRPRRAERGVALVITLVMLSVVTFMALAFLAISRRERAAVTVIEEQSRARLMAETAVARAQAEMVARVITASNLLNYDFLVSTNFISPYGFDASQPANGVNPTNVNYEHVMGGGAMANNVNLWVRNIANLLYDPRPPVFVRTNTSDVRFPQDFRFFLDLNRNQRFESNGPLPVVGYRGQWLGLDGLEWRTGQPVMSNYFVGDPEWVGMLQYPGLAHNPTNRFLGRFAFLVQPAGKSLDLNFIGNHALRTQDREVDDDGYYRNQGFGSWELNLAAFLRDLNTNVTQNYSYRGLAGPSSSEAARDALSFLRYRYNGDLTNLLSVKLLFGQAGADAFQADRIDGYADGPPYTNSAVLASDNDLIPDNKPWSGSDNPNAFVSLQELFDTNKIIGPATGTRMTWPGRLLEAQLGRSSYDRYTFYRLLGQLGTDSGPGEQGKINLNYKNVPPFGATNFVNWTNATEFFYAAANRLLLAARQTNVVLSGGRYYTNFYIGGALVRPGLSLTNIQVYPYNEYSAEVHRLLQLAVNLYDATTNRATVSGYPYLPTAFQPMFGAIGTNLFITGYREITNATFLVADNIPVRNLALPADRDRIAKEPFSIVYDVPFLIGVKKGLPNFNEFSLRNVAQVTRKVQLRKNSPTDLRPSQTNLLYLLTLTNQFGVELWNSYATNYPRNLQVRLIGQVGVTLHDAAKGRIPLRSITNTYSVKTNYAAWASNGFYLPVLGASVLAESQGYRPVPTPVLDPPGAERFVPNLGSYMPDWTLNVTNSFICAIVDVGVSPNPRLVDFVTIGSMKALMNVTGELAGRAQLAIPGATTEPANTWLTNRVGAGTNAPMQGVINQIEISLGNEPVSPAQWRSFSQAGAEGRDKEKSIDRFRVFCGLTPLVFTSEEQRRQLAEELRGRSDAQAPYSPTRKLYQDMAWQANDPLVHYRTEDLLDPFNRPDDPNRTNTVRFAVPPTATLTNSNLGRVNERYAPWGGNPNLTPGVLAYDNRVKDPNVRRSDDWDFPTNKFPNLGWIGRVHRGTPWQTLYLKSGVAPTNRWLGWAGNLGTHPTNDWPLIEVFTVAPNENAARGLLSVNQTNLAAWSAVLSGVTVLSNVTPANTVLTLTNRPQFTPVIIQPDLPGYPQLRTIVEGINRTRQMEVMANRQTIPVFNRLGRILATPELTVASPFLSTNNLATDAALERIPEQILSLLREDEPRFVVYAFGQSLREAPNSLYLEAGGLNRLCTNYQVTAEYATKAVIRLEGLPTNPRAVIESYQELPPQ